jgi:hypothetical protein
MKYFQYFDTLTKKSQRATELKRTNTTANTSCSIFAEDETTEIFYILVDIGEGTIKSVEKRISELRSVKIIITYSKCPIINSCT